jgi:uncharacterized membrane protein (UPF0127 family)
MDSKLSLFIAVLAAAAIAVTIIAFALSVKPAGAPQIPPSSFSFGNATFRFTAYAVTEQQREHGLMNTTVTDSTLMLFVFPNASIYPFWMYDTYYPLDMIWVNTTANLSEGAVVYVAADAVPCLSGNCTIYTPSAPADYVIEAGAGFAGAHGIRPGSRLRFNK